MVVDSKTCETTLERAMVCSSYALMVALVGCNVDDSPKSTGGVNLDNAGASGGSADGSDDQAGSASDSSAAGASGKGATACKRGVVIVTSDRQSTNIAISKLDGTTLSPSFVSSGATKPGLALALSGDVDVPAVAPTSDRVVIIDRYGTNVLTWFNLSNASVIAQLPIGTGFESNPHDYIEVDEERAFVSRFGTNMDPGQEAFDEGGDLLIIDTKEPAILGRLPMPEEDEDLLPRPSGMTWLGEEVVVTLGRWSSDYGTVGDGRFVGVDPKTDSVTWTVDIVGLEACGRVAVSPSGELAAIACSSKYDRDTGRFVPENSDIVIYDATTMPPQQLRRLKVGVELKAGIQPDIEFATEGVILAKTYGGNATVGDTAFAVDATTGEALKLAEADSPYVFGGLHCSPGCGNICLMSDAEDSVLRRWSVSKTGEFEALDDVTVDTEISLPPRSIGEL